MLKTDVIKGYNKIKGLGNYSKDILMSDWVSITSGSNSGKFRARINHKLKSVNIQVSLWVENVLNKDITIQIIDENNIDLISITNIEAKLILTVIDGNIASPQTGQIIDGLTSSSRTDTLSANQGRVLKGMIDSFTNGSDTNLRDMNNRINTLVQKNITIEGNIDTNKKDIGNIKTDVTNVKESIKNIDQYITPEKIMEKINSELGGSGSGHLGNDVINVDKNGVKFEHKAINTYTEMDKENNASFDKETNKMVASFRKTASIPKQYSEYIKSEDIDCPNIAKIKSFDDITVYVKSGGSGDLSGKNENNCAISINDALKKFKGSATHLNGTLHIVIKNGYYEGRIHDTKITDVHGSGELNIRFEENVYFRSRILVDSCTKLINITSDGKTNDDKQGAMIYPTWKTPCIDIINSKVSVSGLKLHINDVREDYCVGVRATKGAKVTVSDCDFWLLRAGIGAYDNDTKVWAFDNRGSVMEYSALVFEMAHLSMAWKIPDSNHPSENGGIYSHRFGSFELHDIEVKGTKQWNEPTSQEQECVGIFEGVNIYSTRKYNEGNIIYQSTDKDSDIYGFWCGVVDFEDRIKDFAEGGKNTTATLTLKALDGEYGNNSPIKIKVTTDNTKSGTEIGSISKGQTKTISIPSGDILNYLITGGKLMFYSEDKNDYLKIDPQSLKITITTRKNV